MRSMYDHNANWRNHRWSFDSDFTEIESVPILAKQLLDHKTFFDDTYYFQIHGKGRYVVRTPHYGMMKNYRMRMEKPKDPFQRKLIDG